MLIARVCVLARYDLFDRFCQTFDVIHLTHSVAMELGVSRSTAFARGIATPIFGKAFGIDADRSDTTITPHETALETMQAIRRFGLPDDVAQSERPCGLAVTIRPL